MLRMSRLQIQYNTSSDVMHSEFLARVYRGLPRCIRNECYQLTPAVSSDNGTRFTTTLIVDSMTYWADLKMPTHRKPRLAHDTLEISLLSKCMDAAN